MRERDVEKKGDNDGVRGKRGKETETGKGRGLKGLLLFFSSLSITSEGENNLLPGCFSSFVRFVLIPLYFH